jgi:hypothetical protein
MLSVRPLVLAACLLPLAACGGDPSNTGTTGTTGNTGGGGSNTHKLPSSTDEVFLRRVAGGAVDVVGVDLATDTVTSIAGPIPGTTGPGGPSGVGDIAIDGDHVWRSGDRILVSTRSQTDTALHALVEGNWREIARAASLWVRPSADLRLVALYIEDTPDASAGHLRTYDGKEIIGPIQVGPPGDTFPRWQALSPAGRWAAYRANKQDVHVIEIGDDGTITADRSFARPEPPDTLMQSVLCALPTTMILVDYPDTSWVDSTLAPIASPDFAGDLGTLLFDYRYDLCQWQVTGPEGGPLVVRSFDDRELTQRFLMDPSWGDLLTAGGGAYVQNDTVRATLSSTDGQVLGQYEPAPAVGAGSGRAMRLLATNFPGPSQDDTPLTSGLRALLWQVEWSVSGNAPPSIPSENDIDLWVVHDGAARTLRLRTDTRDTSDPTSSFAGLPESFRFAADGKHVVWVDQGKVRAVDITADVLTKRVLGGDGYVDASMTVPK